ncbi:MAG: polymer-forming cytoskeletal protein [Oscillospiraceae bacterium]|nr:polymer-forming cytoskeletal protein [Oscillospiraceae bacterium]
MDMRIAGTGCIGAGEYDNVEISGAGKSEGFIRCKNFECSGAFSGNSDIECEGKMETSGAFKNVGTIKTKEFEASGSAKNCGNFTADTIDVSGAFKVEGNCVSAVEAEISGGCGIEGNLKAAELEVDGGLKVTGDLEAEKAEIHGGISCGGLINAEELYIELSNTVDSKAESIGGSRITIENSGRNRIFGFFSGRKKGVMKVAESIEGDDINVEYTSAKTVTGKNVVIGDKCEIELVQYSENVEISPKAKIGKCEKI